MFVVDWNERVDDYLRREGEEILKRIVKTVFVLLSYRSTVFRPNFGWLLILTWNRGRVSRLRASSARPTPLPMYSVTKKKIQFSHNQFDPVKRNYKSIINKRALILVKRHREEDPFLQGRTGLSGGAGRLIRTLLSMNPSVEKHLPPKSNETIAKDWKK